MSKQAASGGGGRTLELKVLQQLDSLCEGGVLLQTALAATDEPFWQRTGLGAGDGVDGHGAVGGDFHAVQCLL